MAQLFKRGQADNRWWLTKQKQSTATCLAANCWRAQMQRPREMWCRYHFNMWSEKRREYEYARASGMCVYCRQFAAMIRGVCCTGCFSLHESLVRAEAELKPQPKFEFYYEHWLRQGLPSQAVEKLLEKS